MYNVLHNSKVARTSAYIKTPGTCNYLQCGLTNIKKADDACFNHCTMYHQTKQDNYDDRLTVLCKFNSTYNYTNISCPTSLEDGKIFEVHNELSSNSYIMNDTTKVITYQLGTFVFLCPLPRVRNEIHDDNCYNTQ